MQTKPHFSRALETKLERCREGAGDLGGKNQHHFCLKSPDVFLKEQEPRKIADKSCYNYVL